MSFNSAMLEQMQAEGLDLDACIRVFKAAERKSDPTNAERQARFRASKKAHHGSNAVTVTGVTSPNEIDNLTPTREEKPPPKGGVKKADRGFRIPSDWEPQPLVGKAAQMVACWQAGALERELAKFKNYWLSKGANAARTDWQRTWVNWLISADERTPRYERPSNPTEIAVQRLTGIISHH